jgi:hypothetical protein
MAIRRCDGPLCWIAGWPYAVSIPNPVNAGHRTAPQSSPSRRSAGGRPGPAAPAFLQHSRARLSPCRALIHLHQQLRSLHDVPSTETDRPLACLTHTHCPVTNGNLIRENAAYRALEPRRRFTFWTKLRRASQMIYSKTLYAGNRVNCHIARHCSQTDSQ